jgi:hypothetical protein
MVQEPFPRFNLATMSGVFPGTRTLVYQRVRLAPRAAHSEPAGLRWARILWYTDPPACRVEWEGRSNASGEEGQELLRIVPPAPALLAQMLVDALAAAGWQLVSCGSCGHWQPLSLHTADGLGTGRCQFRGAAVQPAPLPLSADSTLLVQSALALSCAAWTRSGEKCSQETQERETMAPIPRRAERESDERWTWAGQLRRWLGRPPTADRQSWEERLVERSGLGAGADPCFACQGRIANLGALVVATAEGDKETFSVWRCRSCYTYYLNDWIDRWERTDSLETEERVYRLTPPEAIEVLAAIDQVLYADHPARRHGRGAQRDWMLSFLAGRPVLSHQVRQGR